MIASASAGLSPNADEPGPRGPGSPSGTPVAAGDRMITRRSPDGGALAQHRLEKPLVPHGDDATADDRFTHWVYELDDGFRRTDRICG